MLTSEQRTETLQRLATAITRTGLYVPASIALDIMQPLDFLSSQVALFVQPFTTGCRWEHYALVLTEETSWKELRSLLSR